MRQPLLVFAALALLAREARAQVPSCSQVLENPIVMRLGATQEPHVKALARKLRLSQDPTAAAVQIAYVTSGTCTNIDGIHKGEQLTGNLRYVPGAENMAWDPSQASPQCSLGSGVSAPLDVGNAAAFSSACTQAAPRPADMGERRVGEQAYLFVVPKASSQTALTAEEGYFVFGFGNAGKVAPWDDERFMFALPSDRSTVITTMAALGVPVGKVRGQRLTPTEVLNGVAQSPSPEKTIGLAGADLYDVNRDRIKSLAFRAFGQRYAYFADSSPSSLDKWNVRHGLYGPWSPSSYITRVDAAGNATNPRIEYLLKALAGGALPTNAGFEPLDELIKIGLVPDCAMKVMRDREGGDLSPYSPAEPCHCYFESKVGTPNPCAACTDDTTCGGGKCRHGFCETQ